MGESRGPRRPHLSELLCSMESSLAVIEAALLAPGEDTDFLAAEAPLAIEDAREALRHLQDMFASSDIPFAQAASG